MPDAAGNMRQLRLLLAEDNEADAELSRHALRSAGIDFQLDTVTTKEQFQDAIASRAYDMVLSDYNLGGWTGMEALQILEARGGDVPFLLVSGSMGEERAVECIKQGATDFVLKDRMARLPVAVQRAIEEKRTRHQRRQAEQMLHRSEAELRDFVEHAPFGIFRAAHDGRLLTVNPAMAAMLGYEDPRELLTKNLRHDVISAPAAGNPFADLAALDVQGLEMQWRRKDGKPVLLRLSGRSVIADDGSGSFEGMAEDVSERRVLEEQLRQAQKMEAVGRLAGGIAHDFNNLLMVMHGYTELVMDQLSAHPTARGQAEQIMKAAERAAKLVRQLLAFSRKQVMEPRIIDLNQVIRDVTSMLERLLGERIEVAFHPAADLGRVKADPSQIEQVLMNLAVNASDAMPDGGKLVLETGNSSLDDSHVRLRAPMGAGEYVVFSVTDNGCGISKALQSQVFEPFFTTKEPGKGTGLGLATVYGIVKQSGGFIWLYSEPGQGTTFKIYLPRVMSSTDSLEERRAALPPPPASATILLVEDEEEVRRLTAGFLESAGHRVLQASTGPEAVLRWVEQDGRIDLLLTDMVISGSIGGRELACKLLAESPALRVMFISGYAEGGILKTGVLQQGAAFLSKPFSRDMLLRKVHEVLQGPHQVKLAATG